MKNNKIFDISLPITNKTLVYPGDPKVEIKTARKSQWTLSRINIGSHTGTHLDTQKHIFGNSKGLESVSLKSLIGDCRVLDLTKAKISITIDDLKKHKIKRGERILVKTKNSIRGFKKFYKNYIYLDGDAAEYLVKIGIKLFGIDSLSIISSTLEDNRPHTSLLKKGTVIIETLDLSRAPAGKYLLICLPLRFGNIDGSPVRAVLIKNIGKS